MKVLFTHNRYQSRAPSGENRIVDTEVELLRSRGVQVVHYSEDSDELAEPQILTAATAAIGPIISPRGIKRLRQLIRQERPDIIHLHNVFPLISPWAVRTAHAAGIPVVQTVHNYRHTCVSGMHLRSGSPCDDCVHRPLPWPAVYHACYRGSRLQSGAMAAGQIFHRSTWQLVDRFLTASPHMETRLRGLGISEEQIEWRPTYAEDPGCSPIPHGGGVAFVGRLEEAKGIRLLLDAWTPQVAARWGTLTVAGAGPLQQLVEERATWDRSVEWRGSVDGAGIREVMRSAQLVAIPSIWLEGFPRVAAEAMAMGRPILAWEGAGFSQVADTGAGWSLTRAAHDWAERLLALDAKAVASAGAAARMFYDQHCAPDASAAQLIRVYDELLHGRRHIERQT